MLTNESRDPGRANVAVAWWMIGLSLAGGAVLGLGSFGGPVPPPAGFALYDYLPRRLLRLAHIAGVALPALNLLYVSGLRGSGMKRPELACRALLFGTVALPLLLSAAAFWEPALYALPAPVLALIAACFYRAAALSTKGEIHEDRTDRPERRAGEKPGPRSPGHHPAGVHPPR